MQATLEETAVKIPAVHRLDCQGCGRMLMKIVGGYRVERTDTPITLFPKCKCGHFNLIPIELEIVIA